MQKLNVLLALREKLANRYAQMIGDYTSFYDFLVNRKVQVREDMHLHSLKGGICKCVADMI